MSYSLDNAFENYENGKQDISNADTHVSKDEKYPGDKVTGNTVKEKQPNQTTLGNNPNDINPKLNNKNSYLDVIGLENAVDRLGIEAGWEPAMLCPCVNSDGYAKTDCPICHGIGTAFQEPMFLKMGIYSDNRALYQGLAGNNDTGVLIATPQFQENGFENGIAPRDRITIPGMWLTQSYLFNVTERRVNQGMYIPYKVVEIQKAITLKNDKIVELQKGIDYAFDEKTSFFTPDKSLINSNISLTLSCEMRLYVTNILRETRYAQVDSAKQKEGVYQNASNKRLTTYIKKYSKDMLPGTIFVRVPKQLMLRREDVFLGASDFEGKKNNDTKKIVDPKAKLKSQQILGDLDD